MNGPAFGASAIGTSPVNATGTVSAKPAAMLGNSLPFRLQLEASTAPLTPMGTGPVLQRDERFVMPSCMGDGFDPLGDETAGVTAGGDKSAQDDDKETGDTPLPAPPVIFDIALPVTPATADAVTRRGSIGPGSANIDERRGVPVQAFAVDMTHVAAATETGREIAPELTDPPRLRPLPAGITPPIIPAVQIPATRISATPRPLSPQAQLRFDGSSPSTTTPVQAPMAEIDRVEPGMTASETKRSDPAGSAAPVSGQAKAPPLATAPTTPAPIMTRGERQEMAQHSAPPADAAVTGTDILAETQLGVAASDQRIMQRRANAPAVRGDRLYAAVDQPVDSDHVARPMASALESRRFEAGRAAPVTGNSGQSTTAPAMIQTVDTASSQIHNFAGSLAQQIQPQPSASAAPAMFAPAAPIPFDRQFGQRVGSAIGAAMNAMSVKDGMLLLQIAPERLGKIEIAIDRGSDRLQITTENEAVRGAIAQAHSRIEHELRTVGHRIGSIEVETRDAGTSGNAGQNQSGAQQRGQDNAAQQSHQPRPDPRTLSLDHGGERAADTPRDKPRPSSNIVYA